jgi:hypothetical protein
LRKNSLAQQLSYVSHESYTAVRLRLIVAGFQLRKDIDMAIGAVQADAFNDVILRFRNLAGIEKDQGKFYRFEFARALELKDELHMVTEQQADVLHTGLNTRWCLLEAAFLFAAGDRDLPMSRVRSRPATCASWAA